MPLTGGQGGSWLAGRVVFKPAAANARELEWQADLFDSIAFAGLRVATPIRASEGSVIVGGWSASGYLPGHHVRRRWLDIIEIGDRFHAALAGVPRPSFIDDRTDPWAVGDRVAWADMPLQDFFHVKHVRRLAALLQPVGAPSQLIHGDLTGNVLIARDGPPAVIDFSPYWRPAGLAAAIVVADALVWEEADMRLVSAVSNRPDLAQLLARALIYRVVTDHLFREAAPARADAADPYLAAVELACRLAGEAPKR